MVLTPGDPAPTFVLPTHTGTTFDLEAQHGSPVLLWWFPKASTPTCTREGGALRDAGARFRDAGCVIAGVSYDKPDENRAFADEYGFDYPLLSDVGRAVSSAYGTVRPAGEPYDDMPYRYSFLVDAAGDVAATYDVTDPETHPFDVLADLAAVTAGVPR